MLNGLVLEERKVSVTKNDEENLANQLYVIMQPIRLKIVRLLKENKEPLYIEQIAEKVKEDRRTVSFHLATLAENGFVDGDYEIIKMPTKNPGRGRAGKFYRLTPKVDEVLQKLNRVLE